LNEHRVFALQHVFLESESRAAVLCDSKFLSGGESK
jgi:hypothetical protein